MANLPVRQLGGVGVITDANPYDLPANAFSNAMNVVFDDGKVIRAPVFKRLYEAPTSELTFAAITTTFATETNLFESAEGEPTTAVRFVGSYGDPAFGETLVVADKTGEVRSYPGGSVVFVTPSTGGLVDNEEPWSHCQVAGISVLTRKDMIPYGRNINKDGEYKYFDIGGTTDWPTNTTCAVIKPYLDFMVALNVTKGAAEYPTMVKWSNPVRYDSAISALVWDPTDPANTAGENVLGELKTPIQDGLVLGSQFIIYSQDQVYIMEYTGTSFVFNFRRLFSSGGILNKNCVVEHEGKHFVFGFDDIYMHDGVSRQSLADTRVRRAIYNNINKDNAKRCFVLHDAAANLVYFCYPTREAEVAFQNTQFANKAAVYNYKNDTWSFMDLPNVAGAAEVSFSTTPGTYSTLPAGYNQQSTTYNSFAADEVKTPVMLSITDTDNGLTESRVFALDFPAIGSVTLEPELETLKEAYVERVGIDLDEGGTALRSYKTITAIMPQADFDALEGGITWQVGSADLPSQPVVWRSTTTYRPDEDYKIDMKVSGRYLAYRVSMNDVRNFKLSGFDAEVLNTSRR
jgi:hypothetical protein